MLSPLTPEVLWLLATLQLLIFMWDEMLRLRVVRQTLPPHDDQKAERIRIQRAYRNSPYFLYLRAGFIGALIVNFIIHSTGDTFLAPQLVQQGVLFGLTGLLIVLPWWGCQGGLRLFLVGQALVVTLAAVVWPAAFSYLPFTVFFSMLYPVLLPHPLWWLLAAWGGYTLYFVTTAQWRHPLPLRGQRLEGK